MLRALFMLAAVCVSVADPLKVMVFARGPKAVLAAMVL